MEERRLNCVDEREPVEPVVSAVGLDQGRPFLELGVTRRGVGLEGEEGWERVGGRELEGGGGGRARLSTAGGR